jgi:hypothetical protein
MITWDSIIADAGRRLAALAGQQLTHDLSARMSGHTEATIAAVTTVPGKSHRRGRRKISAWTPDGRARRVPGFVQKMTGAKTKAAIVARFGPLARFARGQAAPAPLTKAQRANLASAQTAAAVQ